MQSWEIVVIAVWGALWTLVSFRPPLRPAWLMAPGFFAAWWTTELAPLHLAFQAVLVAFAISQGALDTWYGWVALAVTVVSWIGLARSVRGSSGTDREIATALAEGLGPEWANDLTGPALDRRRRREWARVLLPFWFRRAGVTRIRNLQYVGGDSSKRLRLDVFRHRDTPSGAPVLLQIHGGGWIIGEKGQQGQPLMHLLAAHGWVCVAINYRLSPKATWPDHLVDCKRALAWIRTHIAEYGGDPDYVVATGGSAGGHLTAMVGLTANDPQYQPGFEDVDTSVRAMIPFYGVYEWDDPKSGNGEALTDILARYIVKRPYAEVPELYRSASPVHLVHADAPPALIVHGDRDTLAPVEEARRFAAELRAVSRNPVVYAELAGAHHAFEVFNSIRTLDAVAGVDRFLAWLLATAPPAGASGAPGATPRRA